MIPQRQIMRWDLGESERTHRGTIATYYLDCTTPRQSTFACEAMYTISSRNTNVFGHTGEQDFACPHNKQGAQPNLLLLSQFQGDARPFKTHCWYPQLLTHPPSQNCRSIYHAGREIDSSATITAAQLLQIQRSYRLTSWLALISTKLPLYGTCSFAIFSQLPQQ